MKCEALLQKPYKQGMHNQFIWGSLEVKKARECSDPENSAPPPQKKKNKIKDIDLRRIKI